MSIKRTIFALHPMIRNLLLLFPLLAVLLLYFLQEGIAVDSLKIGSFKMQGLYLKLDNKLTLKIENLEIPKKSRKTELSDLDTQIRKLKRILEFFEYIELGSVHFTNDTYRLIYADNTLYIDSDAYEIAGMITPQKGGLVATLPLIHLKKQHLMMEGNVSYGYQTERLTFKGRYSITGIKGNVQLQLKNSKATFFVNSHEVGTISPLLDLFEIKKENRAWIDKKVQAKEYRLISFRGSGKISAEGFTPDIDTMQAEALLHGVTIRFEKTLRPVIASQVRIRFHDNRLDFDLEDPLYHQKRMNGSQVALLNLTGKKHSRLLLKLKFHTRYDKEVNQILRAYHIKIPLIQKKGKMQTTVNLDVDLNTERTKVEGRVFISKDSLLLLGGTPLHLNGGEVTFTKNRVALWSVPLYEKWFDGVVNGFINLDTQKGKLQVDIKHLLLGKKGDTSLQIKRQKKVPLLLSYKKDLTFEFPRYRLKIEVDKKGGMTITNKDIKPLLPFIKNLPLKLSNGKFRLYTRDYKKYTFSGEATWKQSYLYKKGGYLSAVPFEGSVRNDTLQLKAFRGNLSYDSRKSRIQLRNINIDAKKMLALYAGKKGKTLKKLRVSAKNSMIRYGKYVLLTDAFDLSVSGKNTTFNATKEGDRVHIEKNGNSLVVQADKIKDKMLQALIHFNGLHGGRYSLELLGSVKGELKGVIDIKGGAIESFKAYNDLIALFNTIPALMTLSDPGFSKKGYVVRTGKIEFRILQDKVVFDKIYIDGKSSTIAGKGTVALESGALNIDLAIRTAREVGKVLGNLPLVGYILFGKDKSITTGVKIVGTLDKPNAKTHPVQEALLYPLEILKRTITSPAHIINQ